MKKLIIGLFVCLCFTSCIRIIVEEKTETLIVTGSIDTSIREGVTDYIIRAYDSSGCWVNVFKYRAKIGTFEIGDTVVIVKK